VLEHAPPACLIGYGASAIHPYLALQGVQLWHQSQKTQMQMSSGTLPSISGQKAQDNCRKALEAGLLKIMSKMGISLIESYMGAQIFEAIGIGEDLLRLGFKGHALQGKPEGVRHPVAPQNRR
jgi:glutamate synthase (ferredoxin)